MADNTGVFSLWVRPLALGPIKCSSGYDRICAPYDALRLGPPYGQVQVYGVEIGCSYCVDAPETGYQGDARDYYVFSIETARVRSNNHAK